MQEHFFPLKLALLDPTEESKSQPENEIFGLKIAIHNKDLNSLSHLWVKKSRWEISHLDAILTHLLDKEHRYDAIGLHLMEHQNTQDILASLSSQQADLTAQRYLNLFAAEWKRDSKSSNTKLKKLKEIIAHL